MCGFGNTNDEDVAQALEDAIAVVGEWTGGSLEEKLAPFGLTVAEVMPTLRDRIVGLSLSGTSVGAYVQGYVEGLVTAMKLRLDSCGS